MAIILRNDSGFQIYLPDLDRTKVPKTVKTAAGIPVKVRILYVDDDQQIAEMGRRVLEQLGYQVTSFTNSLAAREVFHADPQEFDLVITDLSMPLISGLELAADFAKRRPDLPIILYSGSEAVSFNEARRHGIWEFLRKPTNILELARAIRRVLNSRPK